jgi:hypothetical protein
VWPQILPEGRGILVTMVVGQDFQDFDNCQIVVLDPKTGRRTVVLEGSPFARYANGHLVFVRGGSMFRAPFDLSRLAVVGSPVPVRERVTIDSSTRSASFACTTGGTLVYADGPPVAAPTSTVFRLDRQGVERPLPLLPAFYSDPRLSPDGKTLALQKCDASVCKIFLYDIERNVLTSFTPEPGRFFNPVWSPDGRRLAYSGFTIGAPTLLVKNADGSGQPQRLTDAPTETRGAAELPDSWSPDGRTIAYIEVRLTGSAEAPRNVLLASADAKRGGRPWFESPYAESAAAFSPDGKWMAYVSDESGRQEVYLRAFPGPGGRTKVSSDGGAEPVWTRGGRELLYRRETSFMAVDIRTGPPLSVGVPRVLFSGDFVTGGRVDAPFGYDVSRDGNTIFAARSIRAPEPERQLAIVTNWIPSSGATK